jgi:hypothetical protein
MIVVSIIKEELWEQKFEFLGEKIKRLTPSPDSLLALEPNRT